MAAIRHALQRDVFTARDERLLGVVHVTKNGKTKSKKNNFLCLAVTSEQPVQGSAYLATLIFFISNSFFYTLW